MSKPSAADVSDAKYEHLYEARKARNERNATIEECAREAEGVRDSGSGLMSDQIAAAIRTLKEKP